ncbi:Integrator complex subunit 11 [Cucumispora dikerogammari]|nr:Integrator complex subunit 11 [Cucumispora dikerogammari]
MKILTLGAGKEIGKSAILVKIKDKNILFDCGMHVGYTDSRRFPNFSSLNNINSQIDLVLISHFHLDHSGGIPFLTEIIGYNGPIFCSSPTKEIIPLLLSDYIKIMSRRSNVKDAFSVDEMYNSIEKMETFEIGQRFIFEGIEIMPYYAGHVLGACMFYVKYKNESVLYTGDFNPSPSFTLKPAFIDQLNCDVIICESTVGDKIGESNKSRTREFLESIFKAIQRGGKVLIPVFSIGRSQELCMLLDSQWNRLGLNVPIYCSSGVFTRTKEIYNKFIDYTSKKFLTKEYECSTVEEPCDNLIEFGYSQRMRFFEQENIKHKSAQNTPSGVFEWKNVLTFNRDMADSTEQIVLFAGPAMLDSGTALLMFKKWALDSKNLIIFPGYCAKNSVAEKVIKGYKKILIDGETIEVNMEVKVLSFGAHTDSEGVIQMIEKSRPKNIFLIHGEIKKMSKLEKKLKKRTPGIPIYCPSNGEEVHINTNKQ